MQIDLRGMKRKGVRYNDFVRMMLAEEEFP
jgi:hypothetical protein